MNEIINYLINILKKLDESTCKYGCCNECCVCDFLSDLIKQETSDKE